MQELKIFCVIETLYTHKQRKLRFIICSNLLNVFGLCIHSSELDLYRIGTIYTSHVRPKTIQTS